jgi:hypothetical protein
MSEGYLIGPDFLGRIRRVVDGAESAIVRMEPTRVQTRFEGDIATNPKVFRICTFTGQWAINAAKTVTFRNVTTTPNTVSAVNLFAGVPAPTGNGSCAIARDGTAWYLIAAECGTVV